MCKGVKYITVFVLRNQHQILAEEYEIKPVLFLYAEGLVAATKTLIKRKEKYY